MDFAVPDIHGVGPHDPTLLTSRGSDLLLLVPTSHLLARVNGVVLQISPGSLVPDSVNCSILETLAAGCIFVDPAVAGTAYSQSILTHHILPSKLSAALEQLLQQPTALTGLYPERTFEPLTDAVAAIRTTVSRLDVQHLSPAYKLIQADVYQVEPVPTNGHQLLCS
mmetsp:Transcript_30884/g.77123  ORF Transcript_30884/g.77123 Transcript_30884/m.77123 type:complete len:167 (-) Transcript_30884:601-1101(-)